MMPDSPRVLYEVENLRVVLRSVRDYPEGYVEIEQASRDALGITRWLYIDSLSLNYKKQSTATTQLFLHLMRGRCADGELKPASDERI